jgi:hypothetical protein
MTGVLQRLIVFSFLVSFFSFIVFRPSRTGLYLDFVQLHTNDIYKDPLV